MLAQPFLSAITTEGEFSLFYFNGELSHTILKTPKAADFRVQEEHGGVIRAVETDDALREAGDAALRAIGEKTLYARADFVRANDGSGYWLMELELIEPSLYLRMDKGAPERFARALHDRVSGARPPRFIELHINRRLHACGRLDLRLLRPDIARRSEQQRSAR